MNILILFKYFTKNNNLINTTAFINFLNNYLVSEIEFHFVNLFVSPILILELKNICLPLIREKEGSHSFDKPIFRF